MDALRSRLEFEYCWHYDYAVLFQKQNQLDIVHSITHVQNLSTKLELSLSLSLDASFAYMHLMNKGTCEEQS